MRSTTLVLLLALIFGSAKSQIINDTMVIHNPQPIVLADTSSLRIVNFSPFFSLHSDSSLNYKFQINKNPKKYYWFLTDAPAGFKLDKDNGILSFKANKSLFLAGRLKYDKEYPVKFGVQSLSNPYDRLDTTLKVIFYSTDVIYPKIKPSVVSPVTIAEGSKLSFSILCENGNFPIDKILMSSDISIGNFKLPKTCDDTFEWTPGYEFVTEKDAKGERIVNLEFIGTTNFNFADTARVKVVVKDGLNYDIATAAYVDVDTSTRKWIRTLKVTFVELDRKIRKNKTARSSFDITTATSTVTGTIYSTVEKEKNIGKILPGAGVLLVPVKEAAAPTKTAEQNQASLIRANIKRLEYVLADNRLSGDRDPAIATKTNTLKTELRQSQVQLVDVPTEAFSEMSDKELDRIMNSRKVARKYRMK